MKQYDVRPQEAIAEAEQVVKTITERAEEQRRTAALNGNRSFSLLRI